MSDLKFPKVGAYRFLVEPFHCDFSDHIFWGHLGNAMLNAADYHSSDRGYGVSELNKIHKTWVLSRFAIELQDTPVSYDHLIIETWVEAAMKFFTSRNFAVKNADTGHVYGYGRSVWAMIDTDTRQPTDLLSVHDGLIMQYVEASRPCPIANPGRVVVSADAPFDSSFVAHYSDIDINGHVNSVKYIEHVLDLFDVEYYRTHRLQRLEIAYVAESHEGDELAFYKQQTGDDAYAVKLVRRGEKNETVVRCSVKFVKD